ncbi:phosphotransferase [Bacillus sp. Marseille-P3800]|uniref:phosphotransferase n=1 Tax=Bacillus sp. Marseille-P3800 TaxID=2014782 RepID=UPI00159B9A90|nr:phosphotransferase [Bacillus sp. Marseille-P3800]
MDLNWRIEILSEEVNFTTKGIYRISGTIHNKKWSLILKILQEVEDKLDPQHHNYWKREALVLSTTILERYSKLFITPKCYHIEENTDGTVWLWMEEIDGQFGQSLTEENFQFIAHTLGVFNGIYLHEPNMLPSWVCRSWLDSWIKSSQHYSIQVEDYIDLVGPDLKKMINSFLMIKKDIPHHLRMLKNSPQVLAHQDLSKGNICISDGTLSLIDWQFMSVSALGEDLGKLFGVMVSQEMISIKKIDTYRRLLLENYIIGLEDSGWTGNKETLTYAFYISFALRSVWEVPKFVESIIQGNSDEEHSRLQELVTYQLQTYNEACDMIDKKDECINFKS